MPNSPTDWQFCHGCLAKNPIPECPLCEQLNGRKQTEEEQTALFENLREQALQLYEKANTIPESDR